LLGSINGAMEFVGTPANNFSEADFTQAGFELARISVTSVPEPTTLGLLGLSLLALMRQRVKRA
jgi:hypothetical protein